jgi:transcriptional regulator with XRE-family HTH domain
MQRTGLAAARYSKGWSQEEVAERIGVIRNTVGQWERGEVAPHPIYVHRLCELFGKTAEELRLASREQTRQKGQGVETEAVSQQNNEMGDDSLRAIAAQKRGDEFEAQKGVKDTSASPEAYERLRYALKKPSAIDEETLTQFGALTETCMNLSEGSQLERAERILWSYLPEVEVMAQQSSEYQKRAASITSQGYLIAASLVGHHNDLQARQRFSEQALLYGDLAQDHTLQVAALRQLAATFSYLKLPQQVMQTYQRALPSIGDVPPLLRSCIYAALSGVFAQFQQKQDAYHFIGLAYKSFGEHEGDEPYFLRAINASQNLLIHWDGKNHLLLGEPQRAEQVFMRLDVLDPTLKLPKRIRIEAINNRARMFIAVGNMEQACMYLEVAMKTAVEIRSQLRLQEVVATFQSLKSTWPSEKKVQELGDLFLQHLVNSVH